MDVDIDLPADVPPHTAVRSGHRPRSHRFARQPQLPGSGGSTEERRLIVAAQAGDDDALREVYLRFKDNVYGYVRSIVRDEHEAEDVTQKVFAKVLQSLDGYRPRGDVPFSGWLLRIARNMAIDHLRQRRPILDESAMDVGVQPIDVHVASVTLREALEGLPVDQRRVVVMRHVIGLSPPEIARSLGRTESSVHALHHRGRQRLREELLRVGAGPSRRRALVATD